MSQQLNTEQIRQLLNRATAQLDQNTLTRLRNAREQTLERYSARHEHILAFSGHGNTHGHSAYQQHRLLYWIAGLLLVISLLGSIAYWQQNRDNTTRDEDIAILTDDLPIQVYVD